MSSSPPRIAVTGGRDSRSGLWRPRFAYLRAIQEAGGRHFAVQSIEGLAQAAGLLLTGGGDVAPHRYGHQPHPGLGAVDEERDEIELGLVAEALARDLPVLAICRGGQVLVVACGGTLWQDLPSQLPHALHHGRGAGRGPERERAFHRVSLCDGSLAAKAAGAPEFEVNSSHHQAAQVVAPPLAISGWAPDGVIEAVEAPDARFVLGVQWHPEDIFERAEQARIFSAFLDACA